MIRISPIRVIGPDGEQIGVIETSEALKMAIDAGLDLVEISPDTRPPVCKIMDYGKYKYEQSKQSKNKGAKASELKEVRLGRSVKIDQHDVEIRINQARRFLLEGHKVLITQKFKGREMAHRELGINRLRDIKDRLSDISKCESEPRWMGPQASIILAPDKAKCEAYKRQQEKAQKAGRKAESSDAHPGKPASAPQPRHTTDAPHGPPGATPAPSTAQASTAQP
jgi:translation initiation factor IF-3